MQSVPGYETFATISPLDKGWSNDQKYYIETTDGRRLLLRMSGVAEVDRKRSEYAMMERVTALGVPMSRPLAFGRCADGRQLYTLCEWCDGEDVEALLPGMAAAQQHRYGVLSGRLLRRMHTLPAPGDVEPWGVRFRRKIDGRLAALLAVAPMPEGLDLIVAYLRERVSLLDGRPQCFAHGDYNTGNMIATPDGRMGVIDFNYYNLGYGDPWWELCNVAWGQGIEAAFFTGQIQGYFEGEPPAGFFEMLAFYHAYSALAAVTLTAQGEEGNPEEGLRHLADVLIWYDGMRAVVPAWYGLRG